MSFSRRQFIQASGIALCAGAVPLKANAAGQQQPLPVPPLLESRRGQPLFMTLQRAHWSFTQYGNAIYICNHQNNYDMVTAANIVQPPTVTVGKKSLLWIPFFGQLYWLTGNLLIDRNNRAKAHSTIAAVVNHFKKRRISIWMFPEGTRSRGRGLLPFKTGAFHAAIAAGVPVIPVCVSTTSNKIKLNRLNNGLAIVEMLPPVDISHFGKDQVRELAAHCRTLMEQKIAELDKEVAEREAAGKV